MTWTRVLGTALLLGFVPVACAAAPNPKLSSKYEYTIGDDIAQRMAAILRVHAGIEETPLVYYDRDKQSIVAGVFGSTDNVEAAKRDLETLVEVIQTVTGYAKRRHHVDLVDKEVTLIYYVDSDQGTPEEVVRREEGRFVVPKDDEQEK